MKQLEYSIDINSDVKNVWNKMLSPDTYVEWTNVSWPGSFYVGEWKAGSNIRFVSEDGSGTLAVIDELTPYKSLSTDHIAVLQKGGVEDRESEVAKGWIGTKEGYRFESRGNETHLTIQLKINPEWAPMFDAGWPAALKKLKEICEQ